jgi:hypothetical protein
MIISFRGHAIQTYLARTRINQSETLFIDDALARQ